MIVIFLIAHKKKLKHKEIKKEHIVFKKTFLFLPKQLLIKLHLKINITNFFNYSLFF